MECVSKLDHVAIIGFISQAQHVSQSALDILYTVSDSDIVLIATLLQLLTMRSVMKKQVYLFSCT